MKLLIKIFLLIIIALFIYLLFPRETERLIFIPQITVPKAKEAINYQDIPLNSLDLKLLSLYNPKEAWIRVKNGKTNKWILYDKIKNPTPEKSRKMVMFGGETIDSFFNKIAKQAKLNRDKLLKIYKDLAYFKEGDIVAKKYDLPFNITEKSAIAYMLYKSRKDYTRLAKQKGIEFPSKEFKDYLTIASIIEKETQNYKEMPLISAVIHNRLKKDMRLQLDATLNYGKNAHKIITPQIIKNDKSRYNTYKHKGLPPEPICSPSITALKAAMNPANVDYIYFVKSGNKHTFSTKYKAHTKKVANYKKALAKKLAFKKRINKLINRPIKLKFPTLKPKINLPLPQVGYNSNKKKS